MDEVMAEAAYCEAEADAAPSFEARIDSITTTMDEKEGTDKNGVSRTMGWVGGGAVSKGPLIVFNIDEKLLHYNFWVFWVATDLSQLGCRRESQLSREGCITSVAKFSQKLYPNKTSMLQHFGVNLFSELLTVGLRPSLFPKCLRVPHC